MQNLSYENEFDLHENEPVHEGTFSYEWFRTKTRSDTEAKGNSLFSVVRMCFHTYYEVF